MNPLNYHRYETFYEVVRFGGIASAARQMPQRLDRTAVSKQISLLEAELGVRLFERKPFRLTPAGRTVHEALQGLADNTLLIRQAVQSLREPRLRVGVEDGLRQSVLLPAAATWLASEPDTKVDLQSGSASGLHHALEDGEIDLVISLQGSSTSPDGLAAKRRIRTRLLGTRPLVFLVPKSSPIESAEHFWRQKIISERLVTPHVAHPVVRSLHLGLQQGDLSWPAQIATDSIVHVLPFVAAGLGVGVTFDLPGNTDHPNVRILPVQGFIPVTIACHWRAPESERVQTALRILDAHAGTGFARGG